MKSRWLIVAVLVAAACGCSASNGSTPMTDNPESNDRSAAACEVALLQLDRLITARSADPEFPKADLMEAQELYRLARELYLEREYDLALELIEDGIALVKE